MQGAMLSNDSLTVDTHYLTVGKSLADDAHRLLVEVGLSVGRHQHGSVHHQIVGIGSRQSIDG